MVTYSFLLNSVEQREDPSPATDSHSKGTVPWRKLKEYGYSILGFPPDLDYTNPSSFNRMDWDRIDSLKSSFKFIKNQEPTSSSISSDINQMVVIDQVDQVVDSNQVMGVDGRLKAIYDLNPMTYKKFLDHLKNNHQDSINGVQETCIKKLVTKWRKGVSTSN